MTIDEYEINELPNSHRTIIKLVVSLGIKSVERNERGYLIRYSIPKLGPVQIILPVAKSE
jgi:hypothetical protein